VATQQQQMMMIPGRFLVTENAVSDLMKSGGTVSAIDDGSDVSKQECF
jgi:hypothetical protein